MTESTVRRGRMTPEDRAEIERLAGTLKRPTPSAIARRISRHPSTVTWFMLTRGLLERPAGHAARPYQRGGRMVYPYTAQQDARLLELLSAPSEHRTAAGRYRAAAATLTEEFGIARDAHSVHVRSVQLAANPEAE